MNVKTSKELREFNKNLINAKKCIVGETYYLTGMWWFYGNAREMALAKAFGAPIDETKIIKPHTLLNTPVKFLGKMEKGVRSQFGTLKKYAFEMPDGEKIYSDGYPKEFFIKPYVEAVI